jgi:Ribonuclease G/E
MTSEVVIDVREKEISIALLEDKNLVEYQNEPRQASFSVGNIYAAKVKKLMPGLNACFVDVGYERDAFLHYLDLGSQFNSYSKYLKQVDSDRKKLFLFKIYTYFCLTIFEANHNKDYSVVKTFKAGQLAFFVGIPLKGTAIFSKASNFGKDKIIKLLLYSTVSIFAQQA